MQAFTFFLLIFSFLTLLTAQENEEKEEKEEPLKKEKILKIKDPTEMSDTLRKALEPEKEKSLIPSTTLPSNLTPVKEKPIQLPVIKLKAKVIFKNQPGMALLEVDQQILLVRPEDTFVAKVPNQPDVFLTVKVEEISGSKIELSFDLVDKTLTFW
jgi:hypothetical protein